MKKSSTFWLILLFAFLSTGCTSIIQAEQTTILESVILDESNSVGQTFRANFDGLNGIEVYLEPLEKGNGEIQLVLRQNPQSENLGRSSLPMEIVTAPGYYQFPLPIHFDSNQQSYFLLLKAKDMGSFNIGVAPGSYYLDGALYQNGRPDDQHQLAFQLSYDAPDLILGLVGEFILWGWYLLVAAFLFVIPGWALLDGLWPQSTTSSTTHSRFPKKFKTDG